MHLDTHPEQVQQFSCTREPQQQKYERVSDASTIFETQNVQLWQCLIYLFISPFLHWHFKGGCLTTFFHICLQNSKEIDLLFLSFSLSLSPSSWAFRTRTKNLCCAPRWHFVPDGFFPALPPVVSERGGRGSFLSGGMCFVLRREVKRRRLVLPVLAPPLTRLLDARRQKFHFYNHIPFLFIPFCF